MADKTSFVITGRSCENRTNQAEVPTEIKYFGDNTNTWVRGQLLKLDANGLITPVSTTAQVLNTTDIPAGTDLFVALDTLSVKTADEVKVQKVNSSMKFEVQIGTTADPGTLQTAVQADIGDDYALYQDAAGKWMLDKNEGSNAVVKIDDIESNYAPWRNSNLYKNSSGERYPFCKVHFLASLVDV